MKDHLVTEIHLLRIETGSRSTPLASGEWRTILGIGNEHWSARLTFADSPGPGDTFHATVQLLVPDALKHFPVGSNFTVWENGNKGTGRVLSVAA